jgi:hypothetical protein
MLPHTYRLSVAPHFPCLAVHMSELQCGVYRTAIVSLWLRRTLAPTDRATNRWIADV